VLVSSLSPTRAVLAPAQLDETASHFHADKYQLWKTPGDPYHKLGRRLWAKAPVDLATNSYLFRGRNLLPISTVPCAPATILYKPLLR